MSKNKIGLIVGAAVFGLIAIMCVSSYIGNYNTAVTLEETIVARDDNAQNVMAQYGQKIQEAAQIPGMQADDVARVFGEAMTGRYGDDGSGALFQWIQEQNPTLDASVYTNLQTMIEAGRDDFQAEMTILIDSKRTYVTKLRSFWSGFWMGVGGFPTLCVGAPSNRLNADNEPCDDYAVVTTARASDVFENRQEDAPIDLRQGD